MKRALILFGLLILPHPLRAEEVEAASAYCEHVKGAADSESALLLSPQLFINFGVINSAALLSGDAAALPATLRLTAGLRFSTQRLYQGVLLRQRARAECRRYQVVSELYGLLYSDQERGTKSAIAARVKVLRAALPRAEQILDAMRAQVARREATVEELSATQLRVDGLRQMVAQAEADLMSQSAQAPATPISDLLARREITELDVERLEGRLRRSQAWDLSFTGGYDLIFGARDQLPLLGMFSLSFYPGGMGQFHADAHSRHGRGRFIKSQTEGVGQRASRLMSRLRALRSTERVRLGETKVLIADLEERIRAAESLPGERARRFRDYLWFDMIKLAAEHAFLEAHLRDLATILGDGEDPG